MEDSKLFFIGQLVEHKAHGVGRVIRYDDNFYVVRFGKDSQKIPMEYTGLQAVSTTIDPEMEKIKVAVAEVLGDYGWLDADLEMGKRWSGGTLVMTPGTEGTAQKEIPIEQFFKKIISVREKLRVLEQKINNHSNLTSADKVELQGYMTRAYGSLTTFNALFADKQGHFKGAGK